MIVDEQPFSAAYDAEVIENWPSSEFNYEIESANKRDRMTAIQVTPEAGKPWTASVAVAADTLRSAITGLFPTPDPHLLCVVEGGTGFLVDVREPATYQEIHSDGPITAATPVQRSGKLVLTTPWSIMAIDHNGISWRTSRLAIESLRIDEVDDGWLRGVADPNGDEPRDFAIDLSSGRHIGGAGLW
jgi:hypothetical protein